MTQPFSRPAVAPPAPAEPAWPAVVSVALGVFGLVTAEFLPASLLTPMAADLNVSEGMAGQAVTATALVALVTSIFIATASRNIDRRHLLIGFSVLLVASNLLSAFANSLPLLLVGRVLLGVALGGFWTMSTAVVMRLVPERSIPRALSIVFSGVSAATIVAAPVGSFVGEMAGWRAVFLLAAGLGVMTLIAQAATLPSMAPSGQTRLRTMIEVLARRGVGLGMLAAMLTFTGHFAFFTYIRPFLETMDGVGINAISAILLGFGVANFVGTLTAGLLIARSLRATLVAMPLIMALMGFGLVAVGAQPLAGALMIALWGFAFGAVPVAWSTWLSRTTPDQAETAGGLLVAAINTAIATGAAAGGAIYDVTGASGVFTSASIALILAATVVVARIRTRPALAAAA